MALGISLAGSCATIVKYMREIQGKNYAFDKKRATGTLDFLLDPSNGRVQMDNTQMGKKYVETRVHYKLRTKTCEILTDASVGDVCDTASEPAELSVTVDITKRVGTTPKKFTNDRMINICQDTQAFIREYLLSDMNALKTKANDVLLALLDAGSGRNHRYNGTEVAEITNTNLQILGTDSTTGTQVPLFANFIELGLDFQNNQMAGIPNLIGQGNLHKFMQLSKYSCCNADGVAYDSAIAQSGYAHWLDQGANTVLGANEFLLVAPNVAHVLWFNRNTNIDINTPTVQHIVVPDPDYPQLAWDLDFKWDECDKVWIYSLSADFDLFTPPTDQFGAEDNSSPVCEDDLVGTTGIFKYKATTA